MVIVNPSLTYASAGVYANHTFPKQTITHTTAKHMPPNPTQTELLATKLPDPEPVIRVMASAATGKIAKDHGFGRLAFPLHRSRNYQ